MAAFYWRMKNEPRQVVECAVRALHFSPRQHKDIALVNMANVLHRAHFSADAAILVHTALDITSDLLTSHYTLGNIYAMLGEYNHSVLCYDHALQAKPGFEQALNRKHAVLCQQKLEQKLETQHRSLQRTLNELKEYQKQHDQYLRQQEALDKHKLGQEEQILRNIIHETQMAKEAQLGNHQLCRLGKPQGSLHCPYDLPVHYHRGDVFESVELIQFGEDGSTASSTSLISELSLNQSEGRELFPSVSSPPSLGTFWGKEASSRDIQDILWPKRYDCARIFPSIPTPEELPTYFLPPENRGLGLSLSEEQIGGLITQGLNQPLTLLSLGNVCLAQGNVSGAVSVFRQALSLGTRCPECESSLRLIRCLQFYPFLYNLSSSPACKPMLVLDGNGSGEELQRDEEVQRVEESEEEEDKKEEEWQLKEDLIGAFEGALGVKGRRVDLQRIRVLKRGGGEADAGRRAGPCFGNCEDDDGAEWITFQVKRMRKPKTDPSDLQVGSRKREAGFHSALEISGPQIPSPGPPAMLVLDGNGSGEELQRDEEVQRVEESEEEEDKKEEEWQLKEDLIGAFEGALGVKGRRVDLQRIRVLKRGGGEADAGRRAGPCFGNCEDDDGAEWITFQVKRMRKPKTDPSDLQVGSRKREAGFHSALEISGPQIPSPGPPGRRRDYLSLGWPSPDECQRLRRVEPTTVASTWLAVSAKSIDITEHIDFATPLQEPAVEPICNANLPATMHTLDHLNGVANRGGIHYTGESQLQEVLQNLGKDKYSPQSFEQVGTRIAKVLEKNQTSWVLSSMAALYWRVKGQGKKAVDCLRQALNHAPHHMKLWDDAITVASMAVEIAPHFVVNHFTLANVFIAMEEFEKAIQCYESTLKLQPEFAPAKDRLRTIQCHLLTKKEKRVP
ncbi:UNVERIFIED_CONTAM: hypothetical protein FKN15_042355 [Acipenser sinensis]